MGLKRKIYWNINEMRGKRSFEFKEEKLLKQKGDEVKKMIEFKEKCARMEYR